MSIHSLYLCLQEELGSGWLPGDLDKDGDDLDLEGVGSGHHDDDNDGLYMDDEDLASGKVRINVECSSKLGSFSSDIHAKPHSGIHGIHSPNSDYDVASTSLSSCRLSVYNNFLFVRPIKFPGAFAKDSEVYVRAGVPDLGTTLVDRCWLSENWDAGSDAAAGRGGRELVLLDKGCPGSDDTKLLLPLNTAGRSGTAERATLRGRTAHLSFKMSASVVDMFGGREFYLHCVMWACGGKEVSCFLDIHCCILCHHFLFSNLTCSCFRFIFLNSEPCSL